MRALFFLTTALLIVPGCGGIVIDSAGWDLTSGTLTVEGDPNPAGRVWGELDLTSVSQGDGTSVATATGTFSSNVGGS